MSYDESLWKKLRIYKKSIEHGNLCKIIARGVHYLSLYQATLTTTLSFEPLSLPNKLKYLDMGSCGVKTQDLQDVTKDCQNLQKLSLEKICKINEKACHNIAQNFESLRILNLCDCFGIDSKGLEWIVQKCQNLQELNLAFTGLSR